MPTTENNLAERSGALVESHKGYDPRVVVFFGILAVLLAILVSGLAYQQLSQADDYHEKERVQNQRRLLVPGPRGDILDRNGVPLVINKSRWTVVIHLDELRSEFIRESETIKKNFLAANGGNKKAGPSSDQRAQLARNAVAQRYLDQINQVLQQNYRVDVGALQRHFVSDLLQPFTLVDDLDDVSYARLIENLPVKSPLEVMAVPIRHYPFNSAAAHTLGYVRATPALDAEGFPGEGLRTFKTMEGTSGRAGLEMVFDRHLQGTAGVSIYRVDPSGYRISDPLEHRRPTRGKDLVTSLDIDLQLIAEENIGDQTGAAIALDIATGEVLVLASKPDYNLNDFYPRLPEAVYKEIQEKHAEFNYAVRGRFPPGSTFKLLTSIAGMRSGAFTFDQPIIDCDGEFRKYNARFVCYNGLGHHHNVLLPTALAESCDIFFYEAGWRTEPSVIAAEGRRFHLDQATGLESPNDTQRDLILPDPAWKKRARNEAWVPGDTAHMAIGQGDVLLSPLQMACFTASLARNEIVTKPTLLHDPNRPRQKSEAIGLTPAQRAALLEGMIGCTLPPKGTARFLTETPAFRVPGVTIAGKTGTAQKQVVKDGKLGTINFAWFVCFAPADKPEIAMAVMLEGENLGEEFGGGRQAAPVAAFVLKKYFEKKRNGAAIVAPGRAK